MEDKTVGFYSLKIFFIISKFASIFPSKDLIKRCFYFNVMCVDDVTQKPFIHQELTLVHSRSKVLTENFIPSKISEFYKCHL